MENGICGLSEHCVDGGCIKKDKSGKMVIRVIHTAALTKKKLLHFRDLLLRCPANVMKGLSGDGRWGIGCIYEGLLKWSQVWNAMCTCKKLESVIFTENEWAMSTLNTLFIFSNQFSPLVCFISPFFISQICIFLYNSFCDSFHSSYSIFIIF